MHHPSDVRFVTAYYNRKRRLKKLLNATDASIQRDLGEAEAIRREVEAQLSSIHGHHGAMVSPLEGPILYTIAREIRPSQVVETGVANGSSSRFWLTALRSNKQGALHSIDLPSKELEVKEVGWLVPADLRANWELIRGDSREELPRLLERLGRIDIFLHDSLHTLEHVLFEVRAAQKCMQRGSVVIIDDIDPSWRSDLVRCFKPRAFSLFYDLFVMVK